MVLFEAIFGSTLFSSFFESGKNAFGTAFPVLKLTLQVWWNIASAACISLIVSILPLTATAQSSFRSWHTFKMVVCKLFVRTGYTSVSLPFTAWPQMKQWFRKLNYCDWDRNFEVSVVFFIFFFSRRAFWISCGLVYTLLHS